MVPKAGGRYITQLYALWLVDCGIYYLIYILHIYASELHRPTVLDWDVDLNFSTLWSLDIEVQSTSQFNYKTQQILWCSIVPTPEIQEITGSIHILYLHGTHSRPTTSNSGRFPNLWLSYRQSWLVVVYFLITGLLLANTRSGNLVGQYLRSVDFPLQPFLTGLNSSCLSVHGRTTS